ncbi:MAG: chromosome segregation protein SMC [Planctomycetaceae bacterium]|nr:chromosome segregation protein SMC [Planctomycetaceae bacterium]
MRLKSVELYGFKSFPDRTVITFDDGITAILGPNGCGKSNVVDAIKWVLGEKSAKNLRGEEMLDVIFSGCATRKASGMAEVKLIFDNSDHSIPVDYNEVCISRRLTRAKESLYFINGNRTQLKRIREILMDGNVGSSAYSVIEQGRVEALLHAKPADRRAVFEEAAGIAKFKIRRKEILSRLDRTEQILLRVNDRVEEKEKQIRKVAAQAANARRHRRLSEERDAVRLHLYSRQFIDQTKLLKELAKQREALEGELDREDKLLASLGEEFTRLSNEETEITANRDEVTEAATATQEELSGVQLAQANARNRIEALTGEISRGNARRQELAARLERLVGLEQEASTQLEEAKVKAAELEERFAAQDQNRQTLMQAASEVEAAVTALRIRTVDLNKRRQDVAAETVRLEAAEQSAAQRLSEVDARLARLTGEEEEAKRIVLDLETQYAQAAASFGASADRLDAIRAQARELSAQAEQLMREERALESERAAKTSRRATLEDMVNSFDGANKGVRNILTAARDNHPDCRGVVGMTVDLMTVPQDLAVALGTILGGKAQDVVVETARDAQNCIEHLKRNHAGRVTFLPLDRIRPRRRLERDLRHIPGVIGEAVDLVSYDRRYSAVMEYLLAGVLVVDNLTLARELAGREARGVMIVTIDGEVVSPSGAMTGGQGANNQGGLVQRRAELDALTGDVAACERRLAEKAQRHREVADQAASLAREASELEKAQAEAGRNEAVLKQNLTSRRGDVERLLRDRNEIEAERSALFVGGRQEELATLRETLAAIETELTGLESEVATRTEEQRATRERIDSLGHEFATLSGERSTALSRVRELENRIGENRAEQLGIRQELERPGMSNAEAEAAIAEMQAQMNELNSREEALLRLRDERRTVAIELSEKLTECRGRIDALRSRERESQAQGARLREGLSGLPRPRTECEMRLANIQEKAREELGLESLAPAEPEVSEGVIVVDEDGGIAAPSQPPVAEEDDTPRPEWMDWDDRTLQSRVEELGQKLRNIGSVNPEAIDELAELEASAAFLRAHQQEHDEATTAMRAAIERLNEESSTRFQETFAAVRTNFQDMFVRLFGGGRADLFLEEVTDPDADPLDAGIDIHAQPPGKEPKSISLLSGGEKALCAVALLFALFRSKPSPFCILDEVDGPLDEANIDRFMRLVTDFTDETQFIIITHSQRTMGMTGSIWGVTQQEQGISRVMSMNLKRMGEMSQEKVKPQAQEERGLAVS